ncbi:conjugal transfer protein TraH [Agrobacterium vitis]|uniref:Conjugal transfer protein TraH n=1 Tax=Agrobacterium vitis TaxID=373 RepID=A0A6L6VI44_AGRVI|nr:TraH family protein [Agrobacterium vitis]MUZ75510.1 conjugal transfer protein TraH [Agrobacterium vitis]
MIDAVLMQQCTDKALKPEIVEMFIERAGSQDPLAVTVRSGNRIVLVQRPTTPDEALALIRDNLGRNTVRVGITQYPAGLGIIEAGQLKPDLIEPCQNIRMGTALFAKVYRIVTKWYGNPTAKDVFRQVFDDAIIAWQTGYFEGTAVFRSPDPGEPELAVPEPEKNEQAEVQGDDDTDSGKTDPGEAVMSNPNDAGIRIDLSGIGAKQP